MWPFTRRQEKRSRPTSWDLMAGRVIDAEAGVPVGPVAAENLSAAFASVQLIAQTIASLPLIVYRRAADGSRTEAPQHAVARLFSGDVNEHQTRSDFLETMQAALLWHGNAYAEIIRDGAGLPARLVPLQPALVSVIRASGNHQGRRLRYDVTDLDGGTRRLLAEEVLHIRDRSDDGLVGKSRLQRAREAFGTAIATERHAASTFRNGVRLSGVLSHPDQIGNEASENIRRSFVENYGGSGNAGSVAVLEEGLKWQSISVAPEQSELLESRKFTVESVCRLFGVPPQLIGATQASNYANMTEASRHFARFCVVPWCTRWEQALARALFSEADRASHEIELNVDELLRGDPLQRAQTWRVLREIGAVSANEVRREEGWNPRADAGGDEFLSPMNMNSGLADDARGAA